MGRPPRRCLELGCRFMAVPGGSRCAGHTQLKRRAEHAKYGGEWQELSKRMRASFPWCWACGATDRKLQLDHVHPGTLAEGVAVLCYRCNGRKGASLRPVDLPFAPGRKRPA
jgi:hypothetical protein